MASLSGCSGALQEMLGATGGLCKRSNSDKSLPFDLKSAAVHELFWLKAKFLFHSENGNSLMLYDQGKECQAVYS